MLLVAAYTVIGGVSWYTGNVARVLWRDGNKAGAAVVAGLALGTCLFSGLMLLLRVY